MIPFWTALRRSASGSIPAPSSETVIATSAPRWLADRRSVPAAGLPLSALAERAVRRVRFRFGERQVGPGDFESIPNIEHVGVADDGEITVQYRGAVAALLSRAGELGAVTIEAHPVELEETFLALYRGEEDGR